MKKLLFLLFIVVAALYAYTPQGGGVCTCDSCSDCTNALNDNTDCSAEVQLTADIVDYSGNCIENPANFSNKVFDCQGNIIDGDGSGLRGIFLDNKENNTIKNCQVSDFMYGIWLHFSNNNTIESVAAYNNAYIGVLLAYSQNNTVYSVEAAYNEHGIEVSTGSYNNISGTIIHDNTDRGVSIVAASNNIFSDNEVYSNAGDGFHLSSISNNNSFTGNNIYYNGGRGFALLLASNNSFYLNNASKSGQEGFYADSTATGNSLDSNIFCLNDQAHSGFYDVRDDDSNNFVNTTCGSSQPSGLCDNACSICYTVNGGGVCTVGPQNLSCDCLNEALDDNANCYKEVRLTASIPVSAVTGCVNDPAGFTNKTLDCLGNTINGGAGNGILLFGKSGNTIKNCIITGFETGIRGEYISGTVLQNISAVFNTGKRGSSFPPSFCTDSYGIYLLESNNITLLNVDASDNHGGGAGGGFSACTGYGAYLNISNSGIQHLTAVRNMGGRGGTFSGGSGEGVYLEGSYNSLYYINASSNQGTSGNSVGGSGIGMLVYGDNNTIISVVANDNLGVPGSFGGGVARGVYVTGSVNNYLRDITANNNSGIDSYGIVFDTVSNTTLSTATTNLNSYGIFLFSAENNSLLNTRASYNNFHGLYFDSASTGNLVNSGRFCYNNQSGGDYYDIYDEDSNTFNLTACNTSSPDGVCTYSCFSAPSGGGGGESKRHKLFIYEIERQEVKLGETKDITVFVENRGDYTEADVALSIACPESLSCTNASLGMIPRWEQANATISITGNAVGEYLLKAEAGNDAAYAYTDFYFTVLPECTKNDDCEFDEYCSNNVCVPVECECGYIENHACVPYECCSDSDCGAGSRCSDHKCVQINYEVKIEDAEIRSGETFVLMLLADGVPLGSTSLVAVYPDGSTQKFVSNADGKAEVPAGQEGRYKFYLENNPLIFAEGYAALAEQPGAAPPQPQAGQPVPSGCCAFGICGDVIGVCWYWPTLAVVVAAGAAALLLPGREMFKM